MNTKKINFDTLRRTHWSDEESANVVMVSDFIQNLMNDHNFDYVMKNYGEKSNYVQHNRAIWDGISGLVKFLKKFVKIYPGYSYNVKEIIADKDRVVFRSHATLRVQDRGNEKKGMIIIDSWRIENNQIAEHWDAIQAIDRLTRFIFFLMGGKVRNNNSTF